MHHLIFHLTPLDDPRAQPVWKWHLRQIKHYAHLFDGRLIFSVNQGQGFVPLEEILPFLPVRAEAIPLPNHPVLRDCYALPMLLARAYTIAPDDTVFYAHGKGVSWSGHPFETQVRWWSLAMYRWLLSAQAMEMLKSFPFVGWLKFEGQAPGFPVGSKWHFVGTFWWFRAAAVYSRPWWIVHPSKFGAEAYPSALFESKHGGAAYQISIDQHYVPGTDLARIYTLDFWKQVGIPAGPDADSYDGSPASLEPWDSAQNPGPPATPV